MCDYYAATMRFGATVLILVCVSASVDAFHRNPKLFNRHLALPTPSPTKRPDAANKWPFGIMEFASLFAKCHEWEMFITTDPSEDTDPDMTLAIACNKMSTVMEKIKNDDFTEADTALFNEYFPLLQCTNLQIDRERILDYLGETTTDIDSDPFLASTARLAAECQGVFEKYDLQDVSRRAMQAGSSDFRFGK
ncbi:uncharacterized protein LOC127856837 [Dreissena polymorpha]|uniref:Uncharacterized protein n=1 Tax=Dreissena polymorpha TaxID=45954 RepID=A0A9D4S4B0_DREPO|nr:uncharacterized protein LOC127856837 [Dreissena polymorpha]KAH3892034.1 hypothetical protein DPMN_016146 [Dreissena polymorpha]